MNLNQAAHGDREFGFIAARLRLERKVVVGHWGDAAVQARDRRLDARRVREGRLGDRQDRALRRQHARGRRHRGRQGRGPAPARLQRQHLGRGRPRRGRRRGDRRRRRRARSGSTSTSTTSRAELRPGGDRASSLRDGARIELGLRRFLEDGGFTAFTDTFEDLHGLKQLPGLAVQRLMADGYGFGGGGGLEDRGDGPGDEGHERRPRRRRLVHGGLHLPPDRAATTSSSAPTCSRSARRSRATGPASRSIRCRIGGKEDPVRLVFDAHPGPAVAACITDMGQRFRMVATVVDVVPPEQPLPKLPVARAVWRPRPDLRTNAAAWIYAGGSHHTSLGYSVTSEHLRDFAAMSGVELLVIDEDDHPRCVPGPGPLERPLLAPREGPVTSAVRHSSGHSRYRFEA